MDFILFKLDYLNKSSPFLPPSLPSLLLPPVTLIQKGER